MTRKHRDNPGPRTQLRASGYDSIPFHVAAETTNARGDLFTRLITDYFLALGYEEARYDVQKSGREIDFEASHRTERRRVYAECKTTKDKIGGDDINKFVGVLDVERRRNPDVETVGYFISLGGYTETAIEQEREAGNNRVILVTAPELIRGLIIGNIIVPPHHAIEIAARRTTSIDPNLYSCGIDFVAHGIGWLWLVSFGAHRKRTHFALVHADGEVLGEDLTNLILSSDTEFAKSLSGLGMLAAKDTTNNGIALDDVRAQYLKYVIAECGEIQLEGMPADQDAGSRRFKIEDLYVPLGVITIAPEQELASFGDDSKDPVALQPEAIGAVLSRSSRIAILGAPGAGKTTLLKRLAAGYADPSRRELINDALPDREWLPLYIRCRQLGEAVRSPIRDILVEICMRAELRALETQFASLVDNALQSGTAIILIDGLDEISDEAARIGFSQQLRTFLAVYPHVHIVLTSRVAGFRVIAGALSTACDQYQIAEFSDQDILQLTLAWHRHVVGSGREVEAEASRLAQDIVSITRVRALAANPLLLTTLLLVRRWIGRLPTRRTVLYGKALEVLLMTWNVAGHDPIDQEEAVPQLGFVALVMMREGIQQISLKRLQDLLIEARSQMPEVLGFSKLTVSQFIERVELRSSILILSGHTVEDGTLYPVYEFQHLTLQEYLAARAISDGYHPSQDQGTSYLDTLEPYLLDGSWAQVVPMVAILSGRRAHILVRRLIEVAEMIAAKSRLRRTSYPVSLLASCIADEPMLAPELLRSALLCIARNMGLTLDEDLSTTKYAAAFREAVRHVFAVEQANLLSLGYWAGSQRIAEHDSSTGEDLSEFMQLLLNEFGSDDSFVRARAALCVMQLAASMHAGGIHNAATEEIDQVPAHLLKRLKEAVVANLHSRHEHLQISCAWALVWLCHTPAVTKNDTRRFLGRVAEIWRRARRADTSWIASWAIQVLPVFPERDSCYSADPAHVAFILKKAKSRNFRHRLSAYILAYYNRAPWTDAELVPLLEQAVTPWTGTEENRVLALLSTLGTEGKAAARRLRKGKAERD